MGSPGTDGIPFPSDEAQPASKRVLIVEDDDDGAQSMAFLLGLHGHEVRVAGTPEQAYRTAETFLPEVVLLDIRLRGAETVYEVARRLRQLLPARPRFVVITGIDELEARSKSEGIDYHFVKPVEIDSILALLGSA